MFPTLAITLLPTGDTWDAIRVPCALGRKALQALGDTSGAIIHDPYEHVLYWLVPAGTASKWDVPHTKACGTAQYVAVPPAKRVCGPGPHWRVAPKAGKTLTDPVALRKALETAS